MAVGGITNRDYRLLEIMDKLRICRAAELAWLAGFSDFTFCRKKLVVLERLGLVQSVRDQQGAKCYYLTSAGLGKIGKFASRPYEVSYTTYHALAVASVCVWLYLMEQASIFDMLVDLDLKQFFVQKAHRPDIVLEGVAYEVELNHKPLVTLAQNIMSNEAFTRQVWLVPDERQNIARNLLAAAETAGAVIELVPLSQVYDRIAAADIHGNEYRAPSGEDAREALRQLLASKQQNKLNKYYHTEVEK